MTQAQSVASVGGPRELPPASYTGQQYVDSRGCVFLRAGYGGQINWVPRVNAQREVLCGFPPTFAPVTIEVAEAAPAPAPTVTPAPTTQGSPQRTAAIDPATYAPAPYTPPTQRTAAPAPTPPVAVPSAAASRTTAPAPYTQTAPARTYEAAASGPGPGKIGCYTSAPVAEVVRLRNGGTAVVCTKGDGSLSGWRAPIYPAGAPVGAALSDPVAVARAGTDPVRVASQSGQSATPRVASKSVPTPPNGYKLAWDDDRLNPNRAQGTAAGQAAQDQVWTRDVPAKLVAEQPRKKARVTVSTKAEPTGPARKAVAKGVLVQVGSFGQPSNADGAATRLAALGLPVARGRTTKGAQTLQIVFAGPFATTAEAQAALSAARRAGFADAFVR